MMDPSRITHNPVPTDLIYQDTNIVPVPVPVQSSQHQQYHQQVPRSPSSMQAGTVVPVDIGEMTETQRHYLAIQQQRKGKLKFPQLSTTSAAARMRQRMSSQLSHLSVTGSKGGGRTGRTDSTSGGGGGGGGGGEVAHENGENPILVTEEKDYQVIGADEADTGIGLCGWLLTAISWALVMVTLPFSLTVCFKVVQEYERAVIFRLGRLLSGGSKGPGIFFVLPCIESYQKVDLRTITLGVPPQEVLTRDSVTVSVDAVVYYRVSNATVSVANVENAHHSTRLLAQTTLRNILGTKSLHEILSDRESIASAMQGVLDEATTAWGIKVERVEIKDARLPVQLQRAMAAEAEAAREARAKVIAAEGEQKASRALKEASEVIAESSSALQLRYLQTLNSISAEKNSTIIFPLPIDLIENLMEKGSKVEKELTGKLD